MNTDCSLKKVGDPLKVFVYLLTFRNGKCYVGVTWNLKKRMAEHLRNSTCGRNFALFNAILKYGSPTMTVLATAIQYADAFHLEKKLIKEKNTLSPHGYNMTAGGDGMAYWSEEVRQKASRTWRLKLNDPTFAAQRRATAIKAGPKVSAANKRFYATPQGKAVLKQRTGSNWKENITRANRVPKTHATRSKMKLSAKRNWENPEYRSKVNAAREAAQAKLRSTNPEWVKNRRSKMSDSMKAKWKDASYGRNVSSAKQSELPGLLVA